MTKEKPQKRVKGVAFSCQAPDARSVRLTGTFNNWNPEETVMEEAGGVWNAELQLAPGRYEYKFVVDGRWCCDPARDDHDPSVADCVQNPFGTLNRIVEVE